jgi:hypothetical protein
MTSKILYKINCQSVAIAREIEPSYRAIVTEGIPAVYTFKALPKYRKPEAMALRKKVAAILWEKRKG